MSSLCACSTSSTACRAVSASRIIGSPKASASVQILYSRTYDLHEYWAIWRDFRSGAQRTHGAGGGGDGAIQAASHPVCAGEHSSAQAEAASFTLCAQVRHAGTGYRRREGVCAIVAGGAGGIQRSKGSAETELYDRYGAPAEGDVSIV